MINIQIPGNFKAERLYVIDVLMGEFLGLQYLVHVSEQEQDYVIKLENGKLLVFHDHFFKDHIDGVAYLNRGNIPEKVVRMGNRFMVESDLPVIYGDDKLVSDENQIICGIDIFASTFFMLTRWEEYVCEKKDHFERFPLAESLAYKNNFLDRPIVNEYVEMLWNMLKHLGIEQKRKEKKFELALTHDVDALRYWKNTIKSFKTIARDILKFRLMLLIRDIKSCVLSAVGLCKDPFDTFDYLMDVSESINAKSRFFFMACEPTAFDDGYNILDENCRALIRKINERGHLIGLHSSYFAYNDPEILKNQFNLLSNHSLQPITSVRQHCLRFEVPLTWQIMDDNKIEWDSSMGFANKEGFRCGVCYDFSVFNILTRQKLKLKEKSLVAMDVSFFYQGLAPESVKQKITELLNRVRKYNGTFVFLWHNSSLNSNEMGRYKIIYENFIKDEVRG